MPTYKEISRTAVSAQYRRGTAFGRGTFFPGDASQDYRQIMHTQEMLQYNEQLNQKNEEIDS